MRLPGYVGDGPCPGTMVSPLSRLRGLQAIFQLPIRQFPEVSGTKSEIVTVYPGANADQIKGFITTPLQQAVASTEGVDIIESRSSQNVSTITLKLRLDANADRALADVLSKVNEVKGVLPEEANDPVVKRTTGAGFALMYISFKSEQMSAPQISDYLDRVVRPKLQAIKNLEARPGQYNLSLPNIPNHPYFQSVPCPRDMDVAVAAKLAAITLEGCKSLNPSANRPSPPLSPQQL